MHYFLHKYNPNSGISLIIIKSTFPQTESKQSETRVSMREMLRSCSQVQLPVFPFKI